MPTWKLLERLYDHVVVVTADGFLRHLSGPAREDLAIPADSEGQPLAALIGQERAASLLAALMMPERPREGDERGLSAEIESAAGRLELHWVPFDEGDSISLVGVGMRSERPAYVSRQHLDRLVSLGQLVTTIVHEITNPNAVVRGNLAIVREAMHAVLPIVDREAAREPDFEIARLPYRTFRQRISVLLEDMHKATDRVDALVKEVRRFASRDEEKAHVRVDLNEVIDGALRLVANRAMRSVELSHHRAQRAPVVIGDARQLEQVVVNLLLNAVEAIEAKDVSSSMPGAFRVGVEVRTSWQGGQVVLEIRDEGVGIEHALRERIFEPFFTTRGGRGGLGLGLSIVREIVQAHGAALEVSSRPGEGTCFRVVFPA